jgi:hypothetical protein
MHRVAAVYLLEAEQPLALFWRGQFYGEVGWGLLEGFRSSCSAVLHRLVVVCSAGSGSSVV